MHYIKDNFSRELRSFVYPAPPKKRTDSILPIFIFARIKRISFTCFIISATKDISNEVMLSIAKYFHLQHQ